MPSRFSKVDNEILKVAFDGDSVIFSEESQKIFDKSGLEAFNKNEKNPICSDICLLQRWSR